MIKHASYKFFRLRRADKVVGYLRFISPKMLFFSKDKLWWEAAPISYEFKDAYTQLEDCNKTWIFEWDIVKLCSKEHKDTEFLAVAVYNEDISDYMLVSCETFDEIKRDEWQRYRIKFESYLFLNEELLEEFNDGGYISSDIS